MANLPPGHAFIAWAKSIPAVRCVAAAMAPWTHVDGRSIVRVTLTPRFDQTSIPLPLGRFTTIASNGSRYWYAAASVGGKHAVALHAGSEAEEWDFAAVLSDAPKPPRPLAVLAETPRFANGLQLGSSRAAVERLFGRANAAHVCGFDVVRYEPRHPAISEAWMWFVYRRGVVAAFSRYEAV